MRIWIDLANSPQVLFFRPIIRELTRRGQSIVITSRHFAQTVQLADQLGLAHTPIGGHGGKKLSHIGFSVTLRACHLARFARTNHFDLAVSHNSYAQLLAASALRVPAVTLMDYEHQPLNHLAFRLAKRVIVPEPFPEERLKKYGAGAKAIKYSGIKEQLYLADFAPQPDYRTREGFPLDRPLVVVRPPAPWTAYHHFENDLFDTLLGHLDTLDGPYLLFLPRVQSQIESVRGFSSFHIADKVYDGPNLLYHANLVISGGGTMNREAAVLGTRTCTIFKGQLGAVDRYLIDGGRMSLLETESEVFGLEVPSANGHKSILARQELLSTVVDHILATA